MLAGVAAMSKTTGKFTEGLNLCQTISYSGFKQDWIVNAPKISKIIDLGVCDPLFRVIVPITRPNNFKTQLGA